VQAGAGVDFGEEGCLINPVEAFFDVSIQAILGVMANGCENGFDGVMTGSTRSKAIAVRGKACFPFGFKYAFDQCLASAVVEGGNAQGPELRSAGFGYPDPSHGGCRTIQG